MPQRYDFVAAVSGSIVPVDEAVTVRVETERERLSALSEAGVDSCERFCDAGGGTRTPRHADYDLRR